MKPLTRWERNRPCQVLICQGRTCRYLGSHQVLAAFRAELIPDVEIVGSGCLGECGNGPMVLALPDQIWYWRVGTDAVPPIVAQHLCGGHPLSEMLYPKFHRP